MNKQMQRARLSTYTEKEDKMRTLTIFFCAILFLISGCAEIPKPVTFPFGPDDPLQPETSYVFQQQLQSATHWQLVARRTVNRLTTDPELINILKRDPYGNRPPIYIQESDNSPFGIAFRTFLITEIKDNGFKLSEIPDGPINLRWSIQCVYRNAHRFKPFFGIPFEILGNLWTFLMGNWNTTDLMVTHSEIIITTRVTIGKDSDSNIIKSYVDIFYINDGDWDNYQLSFPRSIASIEDAWKRKFIQKGLLSQ